MNGRELVKNAEDYLARGRVLEAKVLAKKAIRAAPESPTGLLVLAEAYLCEGRRDKAKESAAMILNRYPNHARARAIIDETSTRNVSPGGSGTSTAVPGVDPTSRR